MKKSTKINKVKNAVTMSVLLILLGCGSRLEKSKTEIDFWAMGAEGEVVQKLMPEFSRQHPEIVVKVQAFPWTNAQEKLITAYASDNLPDLFQLGNTWIPQFYALNALEKLNGQIAGSKEISAESYFPGIWQSNVMDSSVYGIPWYIDTRVLFYRTDILADAGYHVAAKSWDEFLEQCRAIKAKMGNKGGYPLYLPTNEWVAFVVFGLQNGSTLLKNHNSESAFSEPAFAESFNWLMTFYNEGLSPLSLSEVTNIYQAFAEGYIAMYISGPWNIPEFQKWMSGDLADKWHTAPLPGKSEYPGVSLAGGSSLVINAKSRHKKEAWTLIEYLSKSEVQLQFYRLLNDLPARKEAWNDSLLQNDPRMHAFRKQFEKVTHTPKVPEWEQIAFAKIQQAAEMGARKVYSIEEVLKRLDRDVNQVLEKRRWLLRQEGIISED